MVEMKKVKAADIFPIVKEILQKGAKLKIEMTGTSMFPFLRDRKDSVELSHVQFGRIRRGDIVLAVRSSGEYILHRVFRKERDVFYLIGDNQSRPEGPLYPDQVIALVTAVWKGNSRISCTQWVWRLLSEFWLLVLPFRSILLKSGQVCLSLCSKFSEKKGAL